MTDRPILFSAPMVRALISGTKTQTRRIIKPQPTASGLVSLGDAMIDAAEWQIRQSRSIKVNVADRLWVRETLACCTSWGLFYNAHGGIGPSEKHFLRDKRADAIVERYSRDDETIWNVPSIFMPRWASRLTLIVTDVRVERLQNCSDDDALAEGVEGTVAPVAGRDIDIDGQYWSGGPKRMYAALWDEINGPGAWKANPWVAAYTFTVHHQNIDKLESGQ